MMKPVTLHATLKINFKMGTEKPAMKKLRHVWHFVAGTQLEEAGGGGGGLEEGEGETQPTLCDWAIKESDI